MRALALPLVALSLAACNPMVGEVAYHPLVASPPVTAEAADRACQPPADRARRSAASDLWAQGGEPAWYATYNACMSERGWRRTVALGPGAL